MSIDLEHGYWHSFEKLIRNQNSISRVEQYNGEENLFLACTQLGTSPKYQNEVVNEWCSLFKNTQLPIRKIWVTSRISQKIFDAICHQTHLEGLWIKWGVYPDIQHIEKLSNLEFLHLGGGSSIKDIFPISKLTKLKSLQTNSLFGINDYSFISVLKNIVDLSIEGDPYSSMKKVTLKSLKFLELMPQIIRLNLIMTKIEDHSYLPISKITSLKYLSLPNDKDLEKDSHFFEKFKN